MSAGGYPIAPCVGWLLVLAYLWLDTWAWVFFYPPCVARHAP